MSNDHARIFVFTGTGGSGRKTVARKACTELGIEPVLSYTTRPARSKETHARDYYFVTEDSFRNAMLQGEFLQTAKIDGHWYGTKKKDIEAARVKGKAVYVVVNREAAEEVKKAYRESVVRIFIYVDKVTLKERLEAKGTAYEIVERYLGSYTEEVTYRKHCEHVLQNIDFEQTVQAVKERLAAYI